MRRYRARQRRERKREQQRAKYEENRAKRIAREQLPPTKTQIRRLEWQKWFDDQFERLRTARLDAELYKRNGDEGLADELARQVLNEAHIDGITAEQLIVAIRRRVA